MINLKEFGRTGHHSSRVIFGAVSLSSVSQGEANRIFELLIRYKINHIDTAASYGNSELRIRHWMKEHRNDFFLATKTEKRTYREAKDELHRSLDRLKVDHVDLWQMHNLVDPVDWKTALSPGGALEAFIEAKEQGLARFVGITGHGLSAPTMHNRGLEVYDFDSVLLPYNYLMIQNHNYAKEFNKLLSKCTSRNVAVQTIKSIARGPSLDESDKYAVWYDPLEEKAAIEHAVSWVLGNPEVFFNSVGDIHLLPKVLEAAEKFHELPKDEIMQADIQKYKMTPLFTDERN